MTEYEDKFIADLKITEKDIDTEFIGLDEFIEKDRNFNIIIEHQFLSTEAELIKQKILQAMNDYPKFRQEIDNLMMSLVIFDDDRHKRGEPMVHADAFARYRTIVEKFGGKTS